MEKRNKDDIPPVLKQLAENAPDWTIQQFRAATIMYLGALGETLVEFDKTTQDRRAPKLLSLLRARIMQFFPPEPKHPREAHRQHILVFHQLVVEAYEHSIDQR